MNHNISLGKRTAADALLPVSDPRAAKKANQENSESTESGGWTWAFMGSLVESALKTLSLSQPLGEPNSPAPSTPSQHSNTPDRVDLLPPTPSLLMPPPPTPGLAHSTPTAPPTHQEFSLEPEIAVQLTKKPSFSLDIPNHGSRLGGSILATSVTSRRLGSTPQGTTNPGESQTAAQETSANSSNIKFSPKILDSNFLAFQPPVTSTPRAKRLLHPSVPSSSQTSRSFTRSPLGSTPNFASRPRTSPFGGVVKLGKKNDKLHIHEKLHRQSVQEAMQRELYAMKQSQGYSQDYDTFKDWISYRERLEHLESQDILSASTSRPFADLPRTHSNYSSLRSSTSSVSLAGSISSSFSLDSSLGSNLGGAGFNLSRNNPFPSAYRSRSRSITSVTSAASTSASASSSIVTKYRGLGREWGELGALYKEPAKDTSWLQKAIQKARDSLDVPRPPRPSIPEFEKLRLNDRRKDEEIEQRIKEAQKRKKLPSSLPQPHSRTVKSILADRGFIVKVGREQVGSGDISRLAPSQWLNDEIINFWGALLMERSDRARAEAKQSATANGVNGHAMNGKGKGKSDSSGTEEEEEEGDLPKRGDKEPLHNIHYFNTFFFAKLENPGYEKAKLNKWTKKTDIFKKDIVLIPVNLGNAHWTCAAINFREKRIEYYDSMGSRREKVYALLRSYLDKEHKDKKKKPFDFNGWVDHFDEATPQQENGYDCGVFTCQCMEALSRGEEAEEFTFDQKSMPYIRQRMIWEIGKVKLS